MVTARRVGQEAQADLEGIRSLLNTWLVPNDTRVPTDRFDDYACAHGLSNDQARELRHLRDDIRVVVEDPEVIDRLDRWLQRVGLRPTISDRQLRFGHREHAAGDLVAVIAASVINDTWKRLKACPDCHWVFYDHTRNASKRWCLMNAGGQDGRGCGTIAKVRRHRDRARTAPSS